MSSAHDLREVALVEFARASYAGTSIQQIADLAGLSKSAVLYHFASKESLLEACIGPAIEELATFLVGVGLQTPSTLDRTSFVEGFVDFLLGHPLEVHLFITQAHSLVDVPVIHRGNELVAQLAAYCETSTDSVEARVRFGIALGGSAYLINTMQALDLTPAPHEEVRAALVTIMTELLAPVPAELLTAVTPATTSSRS